MLPCIIPQELADHIIDYLHDDSGALRQCSFVCRSWLPTCRRHVHHHICLESPAHSDDPESFKKSCQFLASSEHLAPYIREFTLRGSQAGSILMGDSLLIIFKMLTRLRTVELERLNWVDYYEELTSLPLLFTSPHIISIHLRYCRFETYSDFLPLVGSTPSLRCLKVVQCCVSDMDTSSCLDEQEAPGQRTYLQSLHLEGADQVFVADWLLHPHSSVSIDRLPELHLSTPVDQNFAVAGSLLKAAGASLEYFDFDFSGSIAHDYHGMNISNNSKLRKLHLRGGSGRSAMFAGNTAVWSQALLETTPPDSTLEEVKICMRMDFVPLRGTHTNRWTLIESLLLEPRFSTLQLVHVHIITCLNIEENPIIKFVAGEMEQMMRTLYDKGILYIQMESDYGCVGPEETITDWS